MQECVFISYHSSLESYNSGKITHKQNKAILEFTVSTDILLWKTASLTLFKLNMS